MKISDLALNYKIVGWGSRVVGVICRRPGGRPLLEVVSLNLIDQSYYFCPMSVHRHAPKEGG